MTLTYALPREGHVRLTVNDIAGRKVATLIDATSGAGEHRIVWALRGDDGRNLPSGQYFVRLDGTLGASTTRITVVE